MRTITPGTTTWHPSVAATSIKTYGTTTTGQRRMAAPSRLTADAWPPRTKAAAMAGSRTRNGPYTPFQSRSHAMRPTWSAKAEKSEISDIAGLAIWASVSEEVDAKIREQAKAGVFPVRLAADDWNSGEINWLLDVIAPNQKATASVIANLRQVMKEGDLRMHPIIARLVDPETLEKMGAKRGTPAAATDDKLEA